MGTEKDFGDLGVGFEFKNNSGGLLGGNVGKRHDGCWFSGL
jgi:hypothetical protein